MGKKAKEQLSLAEAVNKRRDLVRDLLQFRLSLDGTAVQTPGGPGAIQKRLREVDLRIATLKQGK